MVEMKKFQKKFSMIFTLTIIGILGFSITISATDSAIPEWIKNNAKWISFAYFEKFELNTVDNAKALIADDPRGRMYQFRDANPQFFLESLPSADKKQFYEFIADWMDRGDLLNEFDVDIEVLDGTGSTIQIWEFNTCEITSYGTYLQDTIFIYQFSGVQDSEIRDRTHFSCVGIHLKVP